MSDWKPAIAAPSGAKKVTLKSVLLNGGIPLVIVSGAITQWVASRLGYHPALGWNIGGFYPPWDWILWRMKGWPSAARTFELLDNLLFLGLCFAPALAAMAVTYKQRKPKKHEGVHGTAKLAEREDMVAAGLLPADEKTPHDGMYLGLSEDGTYIRHEGPEPILVSCPQRGGKTQGPVIMNALSAEHKSLIVYDVRGDVYEKTAGWRAQQGNRVLLWDILAPAGRGAVRFNPLREVRLGTPSEYGDAANIIEMLADPKGEGLDNPKDHFPPVAATFLTSLTLFCLYEQAARGRRAGFGDVLRAMTDPDRQPNDLYAAMVKNTFGPRGARHEPIARAGAAQLGRADRERASVLSTCTRFLRLWEDPEVVRCTEASDFRLADIMDGDRPAALYITPGELHAQRLRPLVRLFISMLAKAALNGDFTGASSQAHRFRCNLLWDEFIEAKRMDSFLDDMARLGGAGFRTMLFVQDYQQIIREYGRDEPITGHCHIILAYTPSNTETAEWIERWVGRATVVTEDVSESGSAGEAKRGFSRHYGTVSRPLLTADEIMRIPKPAKDQQGRILAPGKMLIKVGGAAPALVTQALYFFDTEFLRRAAIPAPRMP